MKIILNSVLLIVYLLISGCGLIIDIVSLASGKPSPTYKEREKTDGERELERMQKDMDHDIAKMREESDRRQDEEKRRINEENQRNIEKQQALIESLKRGNKPNTP